jgi:hypothetical protein
VPPHRGGALERDQASTWPVIRLRGGGPSYQLFAANRTLRPDSSGVSLQVDGTPSARPSLPSVSASTSVGAQYTAFDGTSQNYDNAGRSAADNNTFRVFPWVAY